MFFRDFSKKTKDVLNKDFTEGGVWKIESNTSASAEKMVINPSVIANKEASVNIECNKGPIQSKMTITDSHLVKEKITYNYGAQSISALFTTKKNYEISHEMKHCCFHIANALKGQVLENSLAFFPRKQLGLGGSLSTSIQHKKITEWQIGLIATYKAYIASLIVRNNTPSLNLCFPFMCCNKMDGTGALSIEVSPSKKVNWTFGIETLLPVCKNILKMKVNQDMQVSSTYISKCFDSWEIAISTVLTSKPLFGVTFTHK